MVQFVGRDRELKALGNELALDAWSLAIVYGRRRIGKSALIQQAASRHGAFVYFQATKVEDAVNVAAFKKAIRGALGPDPILEALDGWEAILTWLARKSVEIPKLVVIIDEFSYLTGGKDVLASILQRFVDSGEMARGMMKLVLCGSVISHMEELSKERNPLFGRRTLTLELREMPLRDASLFFPGYADTEIIEIYATFGGIPYYLQAVDSGASLRLNIERLLLSSTGLLYNEPELLMQTELRETGRYSSIVAAVASGATKLGEIVNRAGLRDGAQVSPYMDTLSRMRIVSARRSFGASPKDKDVRYAVEDPLFRFWYRFVQPAVSAIESGDGDAVYEEEILPAWSTYMGDRYEDICRRHVALHGKERLGVPMRDVGKSWAGDHDLDIVGMTLRGVPLIGECKWNTAPMSLGVLRNLQRHAPRMEGQRGEPLFALFSKNGFDPRLRLEAEKERSILLYDVDELVHAPSPEPESTPRP